MLIYYLGVVLWLMIKHHYLEWDTMSIPFSLTSLIVHWSKIQLNPFFFFFFFKRGWARIAH